MNADVYELLQLVQSHGDWKSDSAAVFSKFLSPEVGYISPLVPKIPVELGPFAVAPFSCRCRGILRTHLHSDRTNGCISVLSWDAGAVADLRHVLTARARKGPLQSRSHRLQPHVRRARRRIQWSHRRFDIPCCVWRAVNCQRGGGRCLLSALLRVDANRCVFVGAADANAAHVRLSHKSTCCSEVVDHHGTCQRERAQCGAFGQLGECRIAATASRQAFCCVRFHLCRLGHPS